MVKLSCSPEGGVKICVTCVRGGVGGQKRPQNCVCTVSMPLGRFERCVTYKFGVSRHCFSRQFLSQYKCKSSNVKLIHLICSPLRGMSVARGALLRLSVWWVGPDPALGVHQKKVATVKTRRSHPSSGLDTTHQGGELPCHGKGVVSKKIEEIMVAFCVRNA